MRQTLQRRCGFPVICIVVLIYPVFARGGVDDNNDISGKLVSEIGEIDGLDRDERQALTQVAIDVCSGHPSMSQDAKDNIAMSLRGVMEEGFSFDAKGATLREFAPVVTNFRSLLEDSCSNDPLTSNERHRAAAIFSIAKQSLREMITSEYVDTPDDVKDRLTSSVMQMVDQQRAEFGSYMVPETLHPTGSPCSLADASKKLRANWLLTNTFRAFQGCAEAERSVSDVTTRRAIRDAFIISQTGRIRVATRDLLAAQFRPLTVHRGASDLRDRFLRSTKQLYSDLASRRGLRPTSRDVEPSSRDDILKVVGAHASGGVVTMGKGDGSTVDGGR